MLTETEINYINNFLIQIIK